MKFSNKWKIYHTIWLFVALTIIALEILFVLKKAFEKGYIKFPDEQEKQEQQTYIYPSSTPTPTLTPTPTVFVPQYAGQKPVMAAFMRRGQIWVKDYVTGEERKVSQNEKVNMPSLSPDGNSVYYFEIIEAGGDGAPSYHMYIADTKGTYEHMFKDFSNYYASKPKWSSDGKYMGVVLINANSFNDHEIWIYDTINRKQILIGKLIGTIWDGDSYKTKSTCPESDEEITHFCNEYLAYIAKDRKYNPETSIYEKYKNIPHDNGYIQSGINREDNGTVQIDYYTGTPIRQAPVMGGYYPGYDEGITDTYSILIDAHTNEVIDRIQNAVETDYIF